MIQKRIGKVFIIISISVVFGLAKSIFLARELPKQDYGLFNLLLTIIAFTYPIALFGQQNAFVRFFSKNELSQYNWIKIVRSIIIASCVTILVALVIFTRIYEELKSLELGFLFVAILGSVIGDLYTSLTRAKGEYEKSIFLQRSIRIVFPPVLLVLYWLQQLNLKTVLISFGIFYCFYSLYIIFDSHRSIPAGSQLYPKSAYQDGFLFLGTDISLLVIISIDKFLIAKLTTLEDLAIYFAAFSITRLYELALQAIEYVLMPYSNKMKQIRLTKLLIPIVIMVVLITLFYYLMGPFLMQVLYKGKYNAGISLIPFFCAVGIVHMFYSIPASIIGGRFQQKALKFLLYSNSSLIVVNFLLGILLIQLYGLKGAILATFTVWLLRTVVAFGLLHKFKSL